MADEQSKPITKFDCIQCHNGITGWLSKLDNRLWALVLGMFLNLLATITALIILIANILKG